TLRRPEDDDPIGGCIDVRRRPEDDKIQVVNFWTAKPNPGAAAIRRSEEVEGFRFVRAPDLVALKLYAGAPSDLDDVKRLLEARPDLDRDEIRSVCAERGLAGAF